MPLCAKKLRIITFSCKIFKNQYLMYEKLRIVTFFLQECYKSLLFPTKSYKSLLFCKKNYKSLIFYEKFTKKKLQIVLSLYEKVTNHYCFVRKSYKQLHFSQEKSQIVTFPSKKVMIPNFSYVFFSVFCIALNFFIVQYLTWFI